MLTTSPREDLQVGLLEMRFISPSHLGQHQEREEKGEMRATGGMWIQKQSLLPQIPPHAGLTAGVKKRKEVLLWIEYEITEIKCTLLSLKELQWDWFNNRK